MQAALRRALPSGAKAKRTVVGTRRVKGGAWEAYACIEYAAPRAKRPHALSFAARGARGSDAIRALLAKLDAARRA